MLTYLANTAWMLSCRSGLTRFELSTMNVAATQRQVLATMLSSNADCEFGRSHRFDQLRDTDDYRGAVPIIDYSSLEPWINRIAAGETCLLTCDPIRILEPTSGSEGSRKLIPYTSSLHRQFRNGIDAWIANLFSKRPELLHGRAYWSITPAMGQQRTEGGIKIGFDEDTEYLGMAGRLMARHSMAVRQSQLRQIRVEDMLRETMLCLLSVPDLKLISVWSPTFLLTLLQLLNEERNWLIQNLPRRVCASSLRRVRRMLDSNGPIAEKVEHLWPGLSLISCWADGPSAGFVSRLRALVPGTEIQPKGLISTEAFVSLPLIGQEAGALAIRSHFFEFAPLNSGFERTCLAHELSCESQYHVVVTTAGGLHRYRTGDIVSVEGFHNECPLIRFVGRGGNVCDLVGEKLDDSFVSRAIQGVMQSHELRPTFACLVPIDKTIPHYCLRIDIDDPTTVDCDSVQRAMESALAENPYYDHAIRIGQLRPLEVSLSEMGGPSHWETYEAQCLRAGIRRGDIKPIALLCRHDRQT